MQIQDFTCLPTEMLMLGGTLNCWTPPGLRMKLALMDSFFIINGFSGSFLSPKTLT